MFGTIESVKAVSELFARVPAKSPPSTGTSGHQPEHVNATPHDAWMIRIRRGDRRGDALLDAEAYDALVK